MIPYRDENPTNSFPFVTVALVLANLGAFVYQIFDANYGMVFAAVPRDVFDMLDGGSLWSAFTLMTSAFLHGDVLHIGFNLLFLWIFGDNVEDRLGHVRFLLFYLSGALFAALCQVVASPASATPIVGASGAISAVLGAYLIFFPNARVRTLFVLIFIIRVIVWPAWIFLGFWFALQLLSSLGADPGAPGVAWWAHIGGFAFGVAAALPQRRKKRRTWA
jgi:membrane associated rhomboid family serine protease